MTDSFGNEVASQRVTFLFVGRVLAVELCEVLETFVAADMRQPGRFKTWWKPKWRMKEKKKKKVYYVPVEELGTIPNKTGNTF